MAPGASSYLEGIAEGIGGIAAEVHREDEMSLEELVSELGAREEWDSSARERVDVGMLLKDIRTILPQVQDSIKVGKAQERQHGDSGAGMKGQELADWENVEADVECSDVRAGMKEQHGEQGSDIKKERKKNEDEEADDVIARIMAELEISQKHNPPSPPPEDDRYSNSGDDNIPATEHKPTSQTEASNLVFPSVPTSSPHDDFAGTQALEDAFTARLAALCDFQSQSSPLDLPSVPSFSPKKKPPEFETNLAGNLDEVDTWCTICTDDATLRCLGCDGDLYCRTCWMEGHRGRSAGFEEQRHRALEFVRRGGRRKEAAA